MACECRTPRVTLRVGDDSSSRRSLNSGLASFLNPGASRMESITLVRNADTTHTTGGLAARVHTIALQRQKKLEDGKVLVLEHEEITLLPGWNSVPTKLWEEAKKNKLVKDYYLANGLFEEKLLTPEEIRDLPSPDAEKLVKETWNEGLLVKMRAAENRPAILALINEQISRLAPSPDAVIAQKAAEKLAGKK